MLSAGSCRDQGLGGFLGQLNDDLVLDVLSFLSAFDLAILTPVSRAMYVFSQHSELWQVRKRCTHI